MNKLADIFDNLSHFFLINGEVYSLDSYLELESGFLFKVADIITDDIWMESLLLRDNHKDIYLMSRQKDLFFNHFFLKGE